MRGTVVSATRHFAIAVLLAALPVLAGCTEGSRASDTGEARASETQRAAHETSKNAEFRAGGVAGNAVAGAVEGARNAASEVRVGEDAEDANNGVAGPFQKVILQIKGSQDTSFTGTCSAGGEERRIGGQPPERYTFSPGGGKIECEISKEGPGTLHIVLTAGDDVRSVQQFGAGEGKVNLTYARDVISVSQTSTFGSVSQAQSSSISEVSAHDTYAP